MKTLKDHVILYDAACPMCQLYTKGFVQSGMLDKYGRVPYQEMPDKISCVVDKNRFLNEIALVHTITGNVHYGVESLLQIIGHAYPVFKPVFRNRIFFQMADKLYKFISFNRRVIIPAKKIEACSNSSAINDNLFDPSFHLGYRTAFLVFAWVLTSCILFYFSSCMDAILPQTSYYREFTICGGQLIWQAAVVLVMAPKKGWDYLGNMMTVSLAGAFLLLPMVWVGDVFQWTNPFLYAGYFGLVVLLMLLELSRRCRLLGVSWKITASWVLYRLVVLIILLMAFYAE